MADVITKVEDMIVPEVMGKMIFEILKGLRLKQSRSP